jgi:hypothetical protein
MRTVVLGLGLICYVGLNSCAYLDRRTLAREEELIKNANIPCESFVDGKREFFTSIKCMEGLPQSEMHGYWVYGFEYSVFYFNKEDVRADYDETATSLTLSKKAYSYLEAMPESLSLGTYEIRFIGTFSDTPGVYQWGGVRNGGVHVMNFLSLKEIPPEQLGSSPGK